MCNGRIIVHRQDLKGCIHNYYKSSSVCADTRGNLPPVLLGRRTGKGSLYTWPPFIGNDYERVGAKDAARTWYERALALNPDFKPARDALARLGSDSQD
jgi:hypothetical protein